MCLRFARRSQEVCSLHNGKIIYSVFKCIAIFTHGQLDLRLQCSVPRPLSLMAAQKKQKVCEERTFLFSSALAGQTVSAHLFVQKARP